MPRYSKKQKVALDALMRDDVQQHAVEILETEGLRGLTLDRLAGPGTLECQRLAGAIHASLRFGRIERIFQQGLHEFLDEFIVRNNDLGNQIHRDFLMTAAIEL